MTDINGEVSEGFGLVADTFAKNFEDFNELGAAVSVRVNGSVVADLWAGTADRSTAEPWTSETLALVFSTTKGAAALCIAMLVESGALRYDAPVAEYWPEFAQAGKQDVSVAQLMSHQAGLIYADPPLSRPEILAVEPVVKALEAQEPLWDPGTKHGYHALTYGWLAGELLRQVDGRSLGKFFSDEVAGPLGLNFWIGLPESEEHRVATLVPGQAPVGEELNLMRQIAGEGTNGGRALSMDGALGISNRDMPFNTREVHATEMPAANGITDARSIAKMYAATIGEVDGVRLTNDETVAQMSTEEVSGPDETLVLPTRFARGFMLDCATTPLFGEGAFGHWGAGGSLGFTDPGSGVSFGYVMNQMGGGIAGDPRALALVQATEEALG